MNSMKEKVFESYVNNGLKMPKDQLNRITIQNKKLDDIIKECGGNYEGTDPI